MFWTCFFSPFSSFNDEKLSYKDYNKRITTHDNGNVESHDKEESTSNSTISTNSGAHILTHDQIIKKSPFDKNNLTNNKTNKILTRSYYLLLGPVE